MTENSTSTPSNKIHADTKSDWIYRYNPNVYVPESTYDRQERYEADRLAERTAADWHNSPRNHLQENIYPNGATTAIANVINKLCDLGLLSVSRCPDPKPMVDCVCGNSSTPVLHDVVGFPWVILGENHVSISLDHEGRIHITIVDNESLQPMYVETSDIKEVQKLIDQLKSIVNLNKYRSRQRG